MSRRTLVIAVGALAFIAIVVAVSGSMTYWFGLTRPVTNAGPAQGLCEDAVKRDLLKPANASFRNVTVKQDRLFEDDNASLGADAAHVKEVWAVDGDVESPGKSGSLAQSHFMCRTYVFDDRPSRAYATYTGGDDAGQRAVRP